MKTKSAKLNFELPEALVEGSVSELKEFRHLAEKAEKQIGLLSAMAGFIELEKLFAERVSLTGFSFEIVSEYDDSGYSDSVNISCSWSEEAEANGNEEEDDTEEQARDWVYSLPKELQARLAEDEIKLANPMGDKKKTAALALKIMGKEGFALWEKNQIAKAAKEPLGAVKSPVKVSL